MAAKTITVRNAERDSKDLGWWDDKGRTKEGAGKHIFLGSSQDAGVAGAPQPEVEVDRAIWIAVLKGSKAVRGMMELRQILVTEGPLATLRPSDLLGAA